MKAIDRQFEKQFPVPYYKKDVLTVWVPPFEDCDSLYASTAHREYLSFVVIFEKKF